LGDKIAGDLYEMQRHILNSHLPECWLHQLVCPRRYRAMLPSCVRANLFGSD